MFRKAKRFNHQLVQFKIKITLLNRDAKVINNFVSLLYPPKKNILSMKTHIPIE